jgi:hypothetical protein
MSRGRNTEIGDFAFHPKIRKVVFQEVSDLPGKLGDRENIRKWTIHRFIRFSGRVLHTLYPEDTLTITERITPVKVV